MSFTHSPENTANASIISLKKKKVHVLALSGPINRKPHDSCGSEIFCCSHHSNRTQIHRFLMTEFTTGNIHRLKTPDDLHTKSPRQIIKTVLVYRASVIQNPNTGSITFSRTHREQVRISQEPPDFYYYASLNQIPIVIYVPTCEFVN